MTEQEFLDQFEDLKPDEDGNFTIKLDTNEMTDKEVYLALLAFCVVRITFTKKDGTERVMNATRHKAHAIEYERKTDRPRKEKPENMISVWDLDKGAWRTVNVDTVKEFLLTAVLDVDGKSATVDSESTSS